MFNRFALARNTLSLVGAVGLFAFSVVVIPSTFLASPVQAATVTSGSCSADVDNATGVTMTVASGGDCVLTFTRTGTTTWTVPGAVTSVRALVVGGGGGGGKSTNVGGSGGGGAGAMVVHSSFSVTGSMSVVVGAGAAPTTLYDRGANGSSSSLGSLVAIGGGGGGDWCDHGCQSSLSSRPQIPGADGGSGGGSGGGLSNSLGGNVAAQTFPAGAISYGNKGGDAVSGANYHGAGGGGAGAAGLNRPTSNILPTAGGIGLASDITGADIVYAAGGGGSGGYTSNYALGGSSIGGNGSGLNANPVATNGVTNSGSGGGGAQNGTGGGGGSGIVVVRYSLPASPTISSSPTITGTARTGSTLTASSPGSWTGSPTSYAYQWQRASSGGSYSNIPSATSSSYDLTDTDIDKYIKVSVIATNSVGSSSAALSAATSIVVDLADSVVPTATTPVATATGFTFTISNNSNLYKYALTTSKGSVSRSNDDVTVTGLVVGESATVTIGVTRTNYKSASKAVFGSAFPAPTTTTTAAPALSIVIQAPVTTVAQGQASVVTLAPTTTTIPVLGANGALVPTTTTVKPKTVVTTTLPAIVTTTTVGPPVVEKVAAGQTAVQVDGVKTAATVTRENNQMVVTAGSLSATMSGLDKTGKTSPLDSDGNIHLEGGDIIKISVGGFKPKTLVEVWLFSTPTKLGSVVVGADGTVVGSYRLPVGVKSGSHRVVVTARMANGKPTTFTLGILVGDISTTSTLTRVLIAIPITLAVGFGFLLPTQMRRRRKIRTA